VLEIKKVGVEGCLMYFAIVHGLKLSRKHYLASEVWDRVKFFFFLRIRYVQENEKNSALHPVKIARALQPWRKYPCAS